MLKNIIAFLLILFACVMLGFGVGTNVGGAIKTIMNGNRIVKPRFQAID